MNDKTKVNINDGYQPVRQKGYQPIHDNQPVDNSNVAPAQGGYQPAVASGENPTPPGDE